ncbi:MAG: hypothetical protein FWD31_06380, partial [Planctomycetaceae bacterium]|nr:hypothetical protein [Planctomycetaceae bacterium]
GMAFADFSSDSPVVKDWMLQDGRTEPADANYIKTGQERRNERLKTLKEVFPKIVFTKHFDLGGSHYAYTEAQSDAQAERSFVAGTALCVLELNASGEYEERTLISDPNGVIRDPAVSYDGKTIVFAWKKSDRLDDYHLYDYAVDTGEIRQLTFGLGYADYEPCLLPDGDIIFNSSRCVQIVDCWWTEVSNLYRCDKDGRFLRRLSYDQVHTNFPSILDDGRIVYTRWDYNDRGQIFPQGLFQMNPDGTGQTEFYGNNSWFPTTLMHTRGIPNTGGKVVSVFSGHHNLYYGKLGIVDITKGRQENSGTQLIAPIRETTADRIDAWGQQGDRFAYPYPINEREFLVGYNSDQNAGHTTTTPFGIYWIDEDGRRELLAYDPTISSHQPVPLTAQVPPYDRPSAVDHNVDYGTFTMQDVYFGPGLEGIERGTAKTLRVIALDFRSTGIGSNGNNGPAGGALVSTPIASGNGTWDVKIPLGDAPIYEDGSASFHVPAKTPLYFQVLDENGHAIQSMRSWATLQPGEVFSCIGCHEDKNTVASSSVLTEAMRRGPQPLKPFYGEPRGFSFVKEIQPILDAKCVDCHKNPEKDPPYRSVAMRAADRGAATESWARRAMDKPFFQNLQNWHYTTEKPGTNWMKPEYFAHVTDLPKSAGGIGAMPGRRLQTPWNTPDIWMWNIIELPDDWKPQPLVIRYFHDEDTVIYVNGQKIFAVEGFNTNYQYAVISAKDAQAFKPGVNYLASHTHQTTGGQGVDFGLWMIKPEMLPSQDPLPPASVLAEYPFSLKNDPILDGPAKRNWPLSYLNLTNSRANRDGSFTAVQTPMLNWINVQESPAMLPPYNAGAAKSGIMAMFDPNLAKGGTTHQDVQLTREELDKLAVWLDMLVPAFGDYEEGGVWNDAEKQKFAYYELKKQLMHELDISNNLLFVAWQKDAKLPPLPKDPNTYRNMAVNQKTVNELGWLFPFDKPIKTDQVAVTVTIRDDFPHGTPWNECTIECSNGFTRKITLQKTADRQVFTFPVQSNVSWLKLTNFVPERQDGWAALTQVEVLGIDDQR